MLQETDTQVLGTLKLKPSEPHADANTLELAMLSCLCQKAAAFITPQTQYNSDLSEQQALKNILLHGANKIFNESVHQPHIYHHSLP